MKFDVVIGNPPYQRKQIGASVGRPIWHRFVEKSIEMCGEGGKVILIHPAGYRYSMPTFRETFGLLKRYQLNYLKLSNYKTGILYFGANTTCDWYVLTKKVYNEPTQITDVEGNNVSLDIRELQMIPDCLSDDVMSIVDMTLKDTLEIFYDSTSYHNQKSYISNVKDHEFIYPVVYTLKQKGPRFLFSSTNQRGHYGVPKIILGKGVGKPVLDLEGNYSCCNFSYSVLGETEHLKNVYIGLCDPKIINTLRKLSEHTYSRNVIVMLRRRFYEI